MTGSGPKLVQLFWGSEDGHVCVFGVYPEFGINNAHEPISMEDEMEIVE